MKTSPYRTAAARPEQSAATTLELLDDRELFPVFGILWISSIVRIAAGISHAEAFATELTLALVAALLLPLLLKNAAISFLRARR